MQAMRSSVSRARRRLVAALACALAPICIALAPATAAQASTTTVKAPAAATLEACTPAAEQAERSATFVGEMSAVPGTARMMMRIELLERLPGEPVFHPVSSPGLGVWLRSSQGVKTYKDLDRVTDLAAPATYRALIRFRWVNARGHAVKSTELRTPECDEAAPAGATGGGSTGAASSGSGSAASVLSAPVAEATAPA